MYIQIVFVSLLTNYNLKQYRVPVYTPWQSQVSLSHFAYKHRKAGFNQLVDYLWYCNFLGSYELELGVFIQQYIKQWICLSLKWS